MRLLFLTVCALVGWTSGCAWEVQSMGEPAPVLVAPEPRLPITVAIRTGAFDESRLNAAGLAAHFAGALRSAGLFESVLFPIPPGHEPVWEIELTASDGGHEPDSNFWKAFASNVFPPLLFAVYLENDYHLELQALLLRRRELVRTYRAASEIRHRYQAYADKRAMEAEALATLARDATGHVLSAIAADAEAIRADAR